MTAEIAVLNRNAVALAADSAVTIQFPEGPKIYHTNKLFTLSKFRPVGVMVYGSADFMGIPWETIIKSYRKQLGDRGFRKIEDYAKNFLAFIETHQSFFPEEQQQSSCYHLCWRWIQRLRTRLRKQVELAIRKGGVVSEDTAKQTFRKIVDEDISNLRKQKPLPNFSRLSAEGLLRRYGKNIRQAIEDGIQNLAGAVPMSRLKEGCALAILRNLYKPDESGLVIAGFGDGEFCPSLCCHALDSIIAGRLRVLENLGKRTAISPGGTSASVIPFAQGEMVSLFMEGIDGDYADFVKSFVARSFATGYPDTIGAILDKYLNKEQIEEVLGRVRKVGKQLSTKLDEIIETYAKEKHTDPIVQIVNYLPKEELAVMAEALVNLTVVKRHVARQAETVGGPIDVAIISRGDGFVWIKRKHYFNPDLNPHFVTNYLREKN
jgi:hypothetical protein